jgi:hypothetical protein
MVCREGEPAASAQEQRILRSALAAAGVKTSWTGGRSPLNTGSSAINRSPPRVLQAWIALPRNESSSALAVGEYLARSWQSIDLKCQSNRLASAERGLHALGELDKHQEMEAQRAPQLLSQADVEPCCIFFASDGPINGKTRPDSSINN